MRAIPLAEGFDSCRVTEKEPVGMSVLKPPSRGNSTYGAYRHSPPSEGIPISEGLTPSGGNLIYG